MKKHEVITCLYRISQKDDMESFKQLYRYYFQRLLRFCISLVHIKESAEEIVNDVFVNLWERRIHLHKIINPNVYLYVAVKNQSLAYLSKDRLRETVDISLLYHDHLKFTLDPEQIMITAEMRKKIEQAVDQLPQRCKLIFKLIKEDGLKYKEAAAILNLSVKTVESQMAIAMKKLMTAILPYTREKMLQRSNKETL